MTTQSGVPSYLPANKGGRNPFGGVARHHTPRFDYFLCTCASLSIFPCYKETERTLAHGTVVALSDMDGVRMIGSFPL